MLTLNSASTLPASPTIDAAELRWAVESIAQLVRQTEPDSIVGAVLAQTMRELTSLNPNAVSTVVGPFRLKIAA